MLASSSLTCIRTWMGMRLSHVALVQSGLLMSYTVVVDNLSLAMCFSSCQAYNTINGSECVLVPRVPFSFGLNLKGLPLETNWYRGEERVRLIPHHPIAYAKAVLSGVLGEETGNECSYSKDEWATFRQLRTQPHAKLSIVWLGPKNRIPLGS